jgi:hypothetical protein
MCHTAKILESPFLKQCIKTVPKNLSNDGAEAESIGQ